MPRASRQPPSELPPGKLGAVSAELALAGRNGLSRSKPKAGAPPDGGSNVTAGRIVAPHAELGYGISARTPKTEILAQGLALAHWTRERSDRIEALSSDRIEELRTLGHIQ